jgi:hypothetical protein
MNRPSASAGLPTVTSAWPVRVALAVLLAALATFLAWQYAMPRAFESTLRLNHAGIEHLRATLGLPAAAMALAPYRAGFRALLGLMWAAWLAAVLAGMRGGPMPSRRALSFIIAAVAIAAAVLWPPSFSCDVYGYVGYARMKVLYGLNPYATKQQWLIDHHDATGPFLRWNIASPYGPLWTTLSVALIWLLRGASLYVQIVAMKLVGAGALVAAAWGGGRVAERLAPRRGELARLAIGLNPLFVIEAAGNAHNDFVMMALVVAALAASLDGRARRAALWAGLAAAIKFLPLLLLPWIVLADRRARPQWRLRDALVCVAVALAPLVVASLPFWIGEGMLQGLRQRMASGETAPGLAQALTVLAAYGVATAWLLRGPVDRILVAWMAVTFAVFLLGTGMWPPWYLSWIWMVALLGWSRRSAMFSYVTFCFAVVLTVCYSING